MKWKSGPVLDAHSGSVSSCSQAGAESRAMIGVWLGAGGAQPSPAGMHRELVQALLLSILHCHSPPCLLRPP